MVPTSLSGSEGLLFASPLCTGKGKILRKMVLLLASVAAALLLAGGVALAVTDVGGSDGTDDRVTSRTYVRPVGQRGA